MILTELLYYIFPVCLSFSESFVKKYQRPTASFAEGRYVVKLLLQSFPQHGYDQQCDCTTDESGNQLGPAEGGRQCL